MRQILKKLNFSEKETDVYLAALKLHNDSVSKLAKQAGIKRTTTYVILKKLKEMGLISLKKENDKQIFICENSDKLLDIVAQKKKKTKKREKLVK